MIYTMPAGTFCPHLLDLIQNNHTLIAGATGAGKSVLENEILKAFLLNYFPCGSSGANLVLIDPKKVELREYKDVPHCIRYADNIPDIVQTLHDIRDTVNARLDYMQNKGLRQYDGTPIYIFVDEIVDLFKSAESKTILRLMSDILSISRATSIYWVILTQAPNREILKAEIVLNMNCRVALRCNFAIESRQIIGEAGAEKLPDHGIGIVQRGIQKFQIAIPMSSESERKEIIKAWTSQTQKATYNRPTPTPATVKPEKRQTAWKRFTTIVKGCKI